MAAYANTNAREPYAKNAVVVRSAPTTAFDQVALNAPALTSANTTASDPDAESASRRTEMQSKDMNNHADLNIFYVRYFNDIKQNSFAKQSMLSVILGCSSSNPI